MQSRKFDELMGYRTEKVCNPVGKTADLKTNTVSSARLDKEAILVIRRTGKWNYKPRTEARGEVGERREGMSLP